MSGCVKVGLASLHETEDGRTCRPFCSFDLLLNSIHHGGLRYVLECKVKSGDTVGLLSIPGRSYVTWTLNRATIGKSEYFDFLSLSPKLLCKISKFLKISFLVCCGVPLWCCRAIVRTKFNSKKDLLSNLTSEPEIAFHSSPYLPEIATVQ